MTNPLNDAQKQVLTSIFMDAVRNKAYDMADMARDKGADITQLDSDGGNLFHQYLWGQNATQMEYIYKCGIDINGKDSDGFTPLHRYIKDNDQLIETFVKFFLDHGADPMAQNKEGEVLMGTLRTKVAISSGQQRTDLEKILLMTLGAQPDVVQKKVEVDVAVHETKTIKAPRLDVPKPPTPKD